MRRTSAYNINRNHNFLNHIRNNSVTPEVLFGQIWLNENTENPSMEIIELNSSYSESPEKCNVDHEHTWSYINKHRRDRSEPEASNSLVNDHSLAEYFHCENNENIQLNTFNNHRTPFTILKNLSYDDSDNDACEIDMTDCEWDDAFDEVNTYDADTGTKRTVWIYSYKNRPMLSEHDYDLLNIPSEDAFSEFYSDDDDIKLNKHNSARVQRVATPIPSMYKPKFNLSAVPTLSTLAEVTEPSRMDTSKESGSTFKPVSNVSQTTVNNWLSKEDIDGSSLFKCANIINWMGLSPRGKKRRFRTTEMQDDLSIVIPEINTYVEGLDKSKVKCENVVIKTEAELHEEENTSNRKSSRQSTHRELLNLKYDVEDDAIKIDDVTTETNSPLVDRELKKPVIRCITKAAPRQISDPIDNLENNNWITDETEIHAPTFEYEVENKREAETAMVPIAKLEPDTANNRLLLRNMALLNPGHWEAYLPIADSVPSLQFTWLTESDKTKSTWLARAISYLSCCK